LGHSSVETTHGYIEIDLEMKRKKLRLAKTAAEQAKPKPVMATQ